MWQVLSIGETVEEVSDSGFLAQAPTLRTQLLADDSMLQVSSLLRRPIIVSQNHCCIVKSQFTMYHHIFIIASFSLRPSRSGQKLMKTLLLCMAMHISFSSCYSACLLIPCLPFGGKNRHWNDPSTFGIFSIFFIWGSCLNFCKLQCYSTACKELCMSTAPLHFTGTPTRAAAYPCRQACQRVASARKKNHHQGCNQRAPGGDLPVRGGVHLLRAGHHGAAGGD